LEIQSGARVTTKGWKLKTETWEKLNALFSEFPFMKAEPVSEDEISKAEKKLGVVFVKDYRDFVKKYGGAVVGPYPIIGLRHADPMDDAFWSVVEVTDYYRREGWRGVDDWYVISMDHADNPIGLDSEGVVCKSDHDLGVVEKVSNSFEEYLLSCLDS
jgi:hypothetical protein